MKNMPALAIITTLTLILLSACSAENNHVDIPVSKIPANVISVIQNALPGISLTEAEKKLKGDIAIYELEGKLINGTEYEIKITESGEIIKIERED